MRNGNRAHVLTREERARGRYVKAAKRRARAELIEAADWIVWALERAAEALEAAALILRGPGRILLGTATRRSVLSPSSHARRSLSGRGLLSCCCDHPRQRALSCASKIALAGLHSPDEQGFSSLSSRVGVSLIRDPVLSGAERRAGLSSSRVGPALLLLAIGVSGFGAAAAFARSAVPAQVTTEPPATTAPQTTAATTPSPTPDPVPVPKPDPKPAPVPRRRAAQPPPPPPPPPAPPATFSRTVRPVASRPDHRASRRAAVAKTAKPARRAQEGKSTRHPAPARAKAIDQVAAPASRGFGPPESSLNPPKAVLAPLTGIAVLLFAAAAISPAFVPWPRVAAGFHAHRSNLVLIAFGAFGIAFALFCVQLVGL